jgi:hypothetical protein
MSEYQYYEFIALDRPLTAQQIDEVREFSSRAEISSTSFVNEYNFGDFKATRPIFSSATSTSCSTTPTGARTP